MSEVQFNGFKNDWSHYQKNEPPKTEVKTEPKAEEKAPLTQSADPSKVLDALSFMGKQNMVFVSKGVESANYDDYDPAKYFTDKDIKTIENSMNIFEDGVSKYADAIKAEFGGNLSEDAILSLAAEAFMKESI